MDDSYSTDNASFDFMLCTRCWAWYPKDQEHECLIWLPTRAPWTCPRCNRVNAPHADQCTCGPLKVTTASE